MTVGTNQPVAGGGIRKLRLIVFGLAGLILVADQTTKLWAVSELAGGRSISVIGDLLQFRLLYNPGAAFSIGEGFTWVFTGVAALIVVAVAIVGWRVRSLGWSIGLGLVLGGAATHLLDRLFREPAFARGQVVDFIDYAGFFVGNVADIAIVLGAIMLAVLNLRGIAVNGAQNRS
ncbi:MAG TPA: signal peptidase II [Kineosporiaceae bacterium]|nr:signal peptidase II [Kineosporiaceae bacterium]